MYVHAYQIDNVLKVFRKQLGRRLKFKGRYSAPMASPAEKANLPKVRQRQTIINQVSADIVKRLATFSHRSRFKKNMKQTFDMAYPGSTNSSANSETEFSYTEIYITF